MAESSPRIFGVHHAYGPQVTPGGENKKRGRETRLSLSVFSGASKQRRCVRVLVRGGGFPRRRTTEGRAPLAGHPAGFVDLRSSAERGRRLARSPREGPRSSRTARLLAPLVLLRAWKATPSTTSVGYICQAPPEGLGRRGGVGGGAPHAVRNSAPCGVGARVRSSNLGEFTTTEKALAFLWVVRRCWQRGKPGSPLRQRLWRQSVVYLVSLSLKLGRRLDS